MQVIRGIKTGMVIHCRTEREVCELLSYLGKRGFRNNNYWAPGYFEVCDGFVVYGTPNLISDDFVEFSRLILTDHVDDNGAGEVVFDSAIAEERARNMKKAAADAAAGARDSAYNWAQSGLDFLHGIKISLGEKDKKDSDKEKSSEEKTASLVEALRKAGFDVRPLELSNLKKTSDTFDPEKAETDNAKESRKMDAYGKSIHFKEQETKFCWSDCCWLYRTVMEQGELPEVEFFERIPAQPDPEKWVEDILHKMKEKYPERSYYAEIGKRCRMKEV